LSHLGAKFRSACVASSVLLIGGLVLIALSRMTREINYQALVAALRSMPFGTIAAAVAATITSYLALVANDFSALRYARAKPPLTAVLLASFCGNVLGSAIGLGSLSGAAVRYRVYAAAGLSAGQIARVTIFIAAAFALGLAATAGLGLAIGARAIGQLIALSLLPLRCLGSVVLVLVGAFVVLCATGRVAVSLGPMRIELPDHRLVMVQITMTMVDITAAAVTLWVLLPGIDVPFLGFVAIYAAALGLGILSHAPGGVGVFEAAVLFAFGAERSTSAIAAALIAYRAIYFLLPLVIATALLAGSEILAASRR
jgi:phosphatidylglycerol lysyltransferase